jgi:hypothetical protein
MSGSFVTNRSGKFLSEIVSNPMPKAWLVAWRLFSLRYKVSASFRYWTVHDSFIIFIFRSSK